ncbi:MAG: hypothetical protein AB8E15_02315 [Bdellovibrionales bacterium]
MQCPKCEYQSPPMSQECMRCGLVFSKIANNESKPEQQVLASSPIQNLWKQVLEGYEDRSVHQKFIETCSAHQKLAFASQQYKSMLEVNPQDAIAKKQQQKIIQIATFQVLSQKSDRSAKTFNRKKLVGIFISTVFMTAGFLFEREFIFYTGFTLVLVLIASQFIFEE